eukprot:1242593-Rhodomonas_salina.1
MLASLCYYGITSTELAYGAMLSVVLSYRMATAQAKEWALKSHGISVPHTLSHYAHSIAPYASSVPHTLSHYAHSIALYASSVPHLSPYRTPVAPHALCSYDLLGHVRSGRTGGHVSSEAISSSPGRYRPTLSPYATAMLSPYAPATPCPRSLRGESWHVRVTCGTAIGYGATHEPRAVRYWAGVCCYALCGTEVAHAGTETGRGARGRKGTRYPYLHTLSGTDIGYAFALCGTELEYGATAPMLYAVLRYGKLCTKLG